MGNCSQRAISDGNGRKNPVTVRTDPRKLRSVGDMNGEYNSRRCSSVPVYGENTLGYLVHQGTSPSRRVRAKIQVSPQRRNGVWKAKVVIGTKQLEEILAVEGNTHALIDQLRVAAAAAAASTSSLGMVQDRDFSTRHRLAREKDDRYFC